MNQRQLINRPNTQVQSHLDLLSPEGSRAKVAPRECLRTGVPDQSSTYRFDHHRDWRVLFDIAIAKEELLQRTAAESNCHAAECIPQEVTASSARPWHPDFISVADPSRQLPLPSTSPLIRSPFDKDQIWRLEHSWLCKHSSTHRRDPPLGPNYPPCTSHDPKLTYLRTYYHAKPIQIQPLEPHFCTEAYCLPPPRIGINITDLINLRLDNSILTSTQN
jgi:hypothetical protein